MYISETISMRYSGYRYPIYTMKISNQSDLMDFLKSEDTYGTIVNDITVSVVFGKLTSSNGFTPLKI